MYALAHDLALAEMAPSLDHSLVPFHGRPRYLRLVSTYTHARDYAAGGFHVSVDRGLAGGCKDPWEIHDSGTHAAACKDPRDREDIRQLWTSAAGVYLSAYDATQIATRLPLEQIKAMLRQANELASAAYMAEGIEPPRDPQTLAFEPVATKRRWWPLVGGSTLAAGLLGLGLSTWASRDTTPGRGI